MRNGTTQLLIFCGACDVSVSLRWLLARPPAPYSIFTIQVLLIEPDALVASLLRGSSSRPRTSGAAPRMSAGCVGQGMLRLALRLRRGWPGAGPPGLGWRRRLAVRGVSGSGCEIPQPQLGELAACAARSPDDAGSHSRAPLRNSTANIRMREDFPPNPAAAKIPSVRGCVTNPARRAKFRIEHRPCAQPSPGTLRDAKSHISHRTPHRQDESSHRTRGTAIERTLAVEFRSGARLCDPASSGERAAHAESSPSCGCGISHPEPDTAITARRRRHPSPGGPAPGQPRRRRNTTRSIPRPTQPADTRGAATEVRGREDEPRRSVATRASGSVGNT